MCTASCSRHGFLTSVGGNRTLTTALVLGAVAACTNYQLSTGGIVALVADQLPQAGDQTREVESALRSS